MKRGQTGWRCRDEKEMRWRASERWRSVIVRRKAEVWKDKEHINYPNDIKMKKERKKKSRMRHVVKW